MQARVETSVDGGTVEIVYTSDPKYLDGLTQEELIDNILGLIPAIISATTYPLFDAEGAANVLREKADLWDSPHQYVSDRSLCDTTEQLIAVKTVADKEYTYWEGQH